VFLPKSASQEVVDTSVAAFRSILSRPDFAELAATELGKYPQLTGAAAVEATRQAITLSAEAKQFVLDWLKTGYGIIIKGCRFACRNPP
jgi:hypothetical protein